MRIIWTRPARSDLRAHILYLAERSPGAARRVQAAIREAVEQLADYPNRGRPGRYEGTRELVLAGLPYLVVYRVRESTLRILRVLHGAQDWPPGEGD
ncbi:MAG TPA: type II toxin-antitoxin system RelE/ParE family toxin [Chloroflexota bacterium]|nr:type II toxin-antitoxin system RelE/ParE family toxin [Chloroflexota bacterium]